MSEMLKLVASAIRKSEAYWWNRPDEPDDGLAETLARAAIEAMRMEALRLYEENTRLRERLGPRGLEVVMIDGTGHYVNEKVKAEIERLRAEPQTAPEPTPAMIDAALNAWFKSPPSETDQGLARSMKAALMAALALSRQGAQLAQDEIRE